MKKYIALILLICLACSMTACSKEKPEEFTIRNGIKFGMSFSEVVEAEGGYEKLNDKYDFGSGLTREEWHIGRDGNGSISYHDIIFDRKGYIMYMFKDRLLSQIIIGINTMDYRDNQDTYSLEYARINDLLDKKYGKNIGTSLASVDEFEDYIIKIYETVWIVGQEDGCIIITNEANIDNGNIGPQHIIYKKINRPYEEAIKEYITRENKY